MNNSLPILLTKYTNCTEDLNLLAVNLELYPFIEYEGWKKVALLTFVFFTFCIEVFMKILLGKFYQKVNIMERPLTIMFIIDQTVQGIGYIVVTVMYFFSILTGIPIVTMFGSQTAGWVFVGFGVLTIFSRSTMSLMMALYRLLCLKANNFMMYRIGDVTFAIIMIILGYSLTIFTSLAWVNNYPPYLSAINLSRGISRYQAILLQKYTEETVNQAAREESEMQ